MLIDYIRQVHANQKFKIKDEFEFIDFDEITSEEDNDSDETPDHIEMWAAVKVFYTGDAPDSYKIMNLTIGDWVASHEKELTKVIHKNLTDHFAEAYPGSDSSEVNEESESSIWLDQLDYMPRVDEKEKHMIIEIELVLDSEPMEE